MLVSVGHVRAKKNDQTRKREMFPDHFVSVEDQKKMILSEPNPTIFIGQVKITDLIGQTLLYP
jgi:hypothetical protein